MDYVEYWRLGEKPFENTRNSKFFFESPDHIEALERMLYLVRDRNLGLGLLTGEVGSGKTITRTVLENRLPPEEYEVVSLEYSNFTSSDILADILHRATGDSFAPEQRRDKFLMVERFRKLLADRVIRPGKHLVLIFDEAQEVPEASLVDLKNLTNMSSEEENYITEIFVGQPELRERIRRLPQLDQRISLRFHLNALYEESVRDYIRHRLIVAGHGDGEVFTEGCMPLIHEETRGIPREVNRLCSLALDRAFSLELRGVDEAVVRSIIKDLHRQKGLPG
jgi:general secretion pathway protein A